MIKDTKFCDGGKAYCINTPRAVRPLWNYFANSEYHSKFSQTGQGESRAFAPREKTVSREGRYFYIKTKGKCYNPNYIPLNVMPESYECRHRAGHSEITSTTDGITTKIRMFVPVEGKYEIWRVAVKNTDSTAKTLDFYSVFGLNSPGMGSRCIFDSEYKLFHSYAFPYHVKYAEYEDKNTEDNYTYLFTDRLPDSYDCGELRFFGSDNHSEIPIAVENGKCSCVIAENDRPLAAMHYSLKLEAGDEEVFYFVLGCVNNIEDIKKLLSDKNNIAAWLDEEFEKNESFWNNVGEGFRIETPDEELDRFVNCWLAKQIAVMNITHRFEELSCVRNELQDSIGYSMMNSNDGMKYLEKVLLLQEPDGNLKQWHIVNNTSPIRRLGLLTYYDGPVWLILCACIVIKQTGDITLFDKKLAFSDGEEATIYEHLMRAVKFLGEMRGPHGLVLFADGDWTDPLNGMGGKGKGETVWGSEALLYASKLFLEVSEKLGKERDAEYLKGYINDLDKNINDNCWDGEWYILGFNDDGERVGVSTDKEGKIFLNAQTWAIISGAARGERFSKTLKTIESIDTPCGPQVNYPHFTGWSKNAGRASLKLSGTTENGAVYCHAVMFKAYADCIAGDFEKAFETIKKTLPENKYNPSEKSLQAPTFVPNYYYGLKDSPNFGISSNVYSTGTASWLMWIVHEQILGIKAGYDGVMVEPVLPKEWNGAKAVKNFGGAVYDITITRTGERSTVVNGQEINGKYLPYDKGCIYKVDISL